jgi:hypothetical protein
MQVCDSLSQRSSYAERRLDELPVVKPEKEFDVAFCSQTSPVAQESLNRKSRSLIPVPLSLKLDNRGQPLQTLGKNIFVKGGLFSWKKIKGISNDGRTAKKRFGHGAQNMIQVFHIPAPSVSEDASAQHVDEFETSGLTFPVPHEEGQEIAIHDNEHCYEDPANVHSMLTMPSLDFHVMDEEDANLINENERNLVLVLSGNDDDTLITDNGAL